MYPTELQDFKHGSYSIGLRLLLFWHDQWFKRY